MSNQCLVLNKSWIPVETVTWQEAFKKIFNGLAYAVEYYDDEIIRTPNDEYLKPAVIVCTEYNGRPNRMPVYSKRLVCQRDEWTCMYCGTPVTEGTYSIDHVIPRAKGGRSTFDNTVCACKPCNSRKADKSLRQSKMKLHCNPGKPKINPVSAKFSRIRLEQEWVQYVECHL
ncbi:HNH endonuclease [Candidatus Bathyarchaeota archaeon]|nr:MAG: HNH endonuclease [Candidatus Bathyarchaeota archaeon]